MYMIMYETFIKVDSLIETPWNSKTNLSYEAVKKQHPDAT